MVVTVSLLLLVAAFACFCVEAIRGRSLLAGGLALWVLALILGGR
jgi:hypothetical protein